MNSVHNSISRVLLNESSGIDLNKRGDSDIENSEKEFAILKNQIISPSAMCSPDVALSNLEDTMKFMMNMQKLPRLMSVPIKKNPWKKMDKRCRRSERIFLLRLDLRSLLFLLDLPMRKRRNLRGVG